MLRKRWTQATYYMVSPARKGLFYCSLFLKEKHIFQPRTRAAEAPSRRHGFFSHVLDLLERLAYNAYSPETRLGGSSDSRQGRKRRHSPPLAKSHAPLFSSFLIHRCAVFFLVSSRFAVFHTARQRRKKHCPKTLNMLSFETAIHIR